MEVQMKFTDQIQSLVSSGKIQEASVNILEDVVATLLGDPISAGKLLLAIAQSPFSIREQLFWSKVEAFLNGAYLSEEDCAKLCAKLTENGAKKDNPYRLVEYIDRAETQKKICYLINATRCLLTNFIDLSTYFRICHAVTHTLEEDLYFLQNHIQESDLSYNECVQGLLTAGLMYQSVIDGNGNQRYSFTPVAGLVDRFAVSYNDIQRYPNPLTVNNGINSNLRVNIPAIEGVEQALSEL